MLYFFVDRKNEKENLSGEDINNSIERTGTKNLANNKRKRSEKREAKEEKWRMRGRQREGKRKRGNRRKREEEFFSHRSPLDR